MASSNIRIGHGFDAHRFGGVGPIRLAGIVVDETRGIEATSDGDVVAHAVADALLGALALGDLGTHFPSSEPSMAGIDSMEILRRANQLIEDRAHLVGNVDVTVVSQSVRVAPHREEMRTQIAGALRIDRSAVSVKATTTDTMGAIGADEGIAVLATVTIWR